MLLDTILGKTLMTGVIAMAPVVELRGAIPYGIAQGLPVWLAFSVSVIGNILPAPFIILFIRQIFTQLRKIESFGRLVDRLEKKAHVKGQVVNRYKTIGLCILVAIPLPGTGAWTGALVAALLDIRLRNAMPAITLGVIIAGIIMTMLSYSAVAIFSLK